MSYLIKNEDNEVMRVVGRLEEAQIVCALRPGWTFKRILSKKPKLDLTVFEEALF